MSEQATQTAKIPRIIQTGLKEIKLLQAQWMAHESQLQNFTPLRDQLEASGQDANAAYRKIQSQRNQAMAGLRKISPALVVPNPAGVGVIRMPYPARLSSSFPALPRPDWPITGVGLGYSGTAAIDRGHEGVEIVAQGKYPATGSIYTVALNSEGVTFDGSLKVEPEIGDQTDGDLGLNYFWLHNWGFVIIFPPAFVSSTFTYTFGVYVLCGVFRPYGLATLYTFVSLGENPNYTTGQEITVSADGGWPLIVDLTQPYFANGSVYGGRLPGFVQGALTVQRSFVVEGGHSPAVAVVVGAITAQSSESAVVLNSVPEYEGYISLGSKHGFGIVDFRYDPLQPQAHQ